jgi:hypothetical protein
MQQQAQSEETQLDDIYLVDSDDLEARRLTRDIVLLLDMTM